MSVLAFFLLLRLIVYVLIECVLHVY